MKKFLHRFTSLWPVLAYLAVTILLGIINFKSGTLMTGWDNLHPEFNFPININRSIFAVWQEYQGLGLLGGMGHASDLVRQLFLAAIGTLMPSTFLRFFWVMLTLFIGSTGAYVLIRNGLFSKLDSKRTTVGFLGGLYYLLNLATIQTYFVPFEAFVAHFAALPWLLFVSLLFLRKQNVKNAILASIVFLLATPAAYIPTLFVTFMLALVTILGVLFLVGNQKKQILGGAFKLFLLIFIVNAFWLVPFLYFTITSSGVNVDAKMNQMATESIFLQNKEFGNLRDVILLKGFWFNNVDPDMSGNFRYMLGTWRNHYDSALVKTVAFGLFALILLGFGYVLKNRRPLHIALLAVFVCAFTMLATNTPPFSWAVALFREFPLFGQAFRFPFTKFSIVAALSFSVLFSFGVLVAWECIAKYIKRFSGVFVTALAVLLLVISIFPAFKGNLFYEKEQLKLPVEYSLTFNFFNGQDPHTRIANLPQPTFWGWNFYTWGYGGSGFLWYGIQQPILDRAFDVWSAPLENYYFELSHALYAKDSKAFENVLNKYQVNWLLVDKNVYSPFSPKALHFEETEALIKELPTIKKVKTFGKIDIYTVDLQPKPKNFLFATGKLPSTNASIWNDDDTAYAVEGMYAVKEKTDTHYIFSSLFSNKLNEDKEFESQIKDGKIILRNTLPQISAEQKLLIPKFFGTEETVPVEISIVKNNNAMEILLTLILPELSIDGKKIDVKKPVIIPLFIIPEELVGTYTLNSNGFKEFTIDTTKENKQLTYLTLRQDNVITLLNQTTGELKSQVITAVLLENSITQSAPVLLTQAQSGKKIEIILPVITDGYSGVTLQPSKFSKNTKCNAFRNGAASFSVDKTNASNLTLNSRNNTVCVSTYVPNLPHNSGYLIDIENKNIQGQSLHFWTLNSDQGYAPLDTYLPITPHSTQLVLPPMEQFGQGYSFHFENIAIGNQTVTNQLKSFAVMPIPYNFLKGLKIEAQVTTATPTDVKISSSHPHTGKYLVKTSAVGKPFTLVLSQSYDKGWKAYEIEIRNPKSEIRNRLIEMLPFIFGKEIKNHIKVNGWENGWEIESSEIRNQLASPNSSLGGKTEIIIIYIPHYFQTVGFFLLWLLIGLFVFRILIKMKAPNTFVKVNAYFNKKARYYQEKIEAK